MKIKAIPAIIRSGSHQSSFPWFVNRRTSERRTELAPAIPREKEEGEANACFSAAEQVSEIQANLLSAAIELTTGGTAQPHVGTGGGGSTSEFPWRDQDKYFNKRTTIKRHYLAE